MNDINNELFGAPAGSVLVLLISLALVFLNAINNREEGETLFSAFLRDTRSHIPQLVMVILVIHLVGTGLAGYRVAMWLIVIAIIVWGFTYRALGFR